MKLATTPEEQRAWMAQWRLAAASLEQIKLEELRALSNEQALRDSDIVLGLAPDAYLRASACTDCGLVEQQRVFAKWHQRAKT
jgi:hypothetical protein